MKHMTVTEQLKMLKSGAISAKGLTEGYISRICELNPTLRLYISLDFEGARARAEEIDIRRARGDAVGALAGIAFAAKDNFCTEGLRTSCGSKMLESFLPPYSATVIERLYKEDCILLGKSNMDEFGMGNATSTSFFGASHNPHDAKRVCGGSSGGSAAAVAAGMAAFALGSDTGGSVRQPAAFCGCVGLKPTYGAISRYGLIAFASSLDTVGLLSASVEDSEYIFRLLCGRDGMDATSFDVSSLPVPREMRVGICRELYEYVSEDTANVLAEAERVLRESGIGTIEVRLPSLSLCVAAYYIISAAEASSNLGRYDGIRYGCRHDGASSVEELFKLSRSEGFGEEVKRRIILGTYCLHGEGREAMYGAATAARADICARLSEVLCKCDALLLPTAPTPAPKLADNGGAALSRWREDAFCVLANLAGLPSISVPFGRCGQLPIGVQLMARGCEENVLFSLGKILEEARP